jgi:hypothetical protein
MDASFGSHPFFEIFKCCRRITSRPILAGGLVRFCGYVWWKMTGRKPVITPEKVAFLRKNQMAKLSGRFFKTAKWHGNGNSGIIYADKHECRSAKDISG